MGFNAKGETPDALWFGTGIHIALAEWYKPGRKRGVHPSETFAQWASGEFRDIRTSREDWEDEAKFEDACDLGIAMLDSYIEKYGEDRDWYIIAIEQPFKVKVSNGGKPIAIFMSAWDGVLRDKKDGRVYLLEHKTAAQINTAYLELDDQGGAYWALATAWLRAKRILKPEETIAGIVYNFLRKAMPDDRPQNEQGEYLNQDGGVSKRQPPPRFVRYYVERSPKEHVSQLRRLGDEVEVMNAMREGRIPVIKNTNRDCTYCEFFQMCILHERGGNDWERIARSSYDISDPYARYRKSAGE